MRRFGLIIKVRPDRIADYERIHTEVWPEVLATIHACNMCNYSIFRHGTWLFAYFEYIGDDFAADMQRMANDPKTQEWWTYTDSMQEPVEDHASGEWWSNMKEVFHTD
jgi:L-rhamnose mutarotase